MLDRGQALKHLTAGVLTGIQRGLASYPNYAKQYMVKGASANSLWELIATRVDSNKWKETHTLFGKVPPVTEDLGTAQGGTAKEFSFDVTNRDWIDSFSVRLRTMDDDQTGDMSKLGEQLALNFKFHMDKFTFDEMRKANGSDKGPTCYDGKGVFSDAHPVGATTADNLDTENADLDEAKFKSAFTKMEGFKESSGVEPSYGIPDLLVVEKANRFKAVEIVSSSFRASGAEWAINTSGSSPVLNPIQAYNITVMAVPFSLGAAEWYLFDSSKPFKALLMQMRQEPTLAITQRSGDVAILNDEVHFVMRARYALGGGYWQYAINGNI